jgi:hypothetical protein
VFASVSRKHSHASILWQSAAPQVGTISLLAIFITLLCGPISQILAEISIIVGGIKEEEK